MGVDREDTYLKQVAERMVRIVGPSLSEGQVISLQATLVFYRIAMRDGFIVNDHRHDYSEIGYTNAAAIAALVDARGRSGFELERLFAKADKGSTDSINCLHTMLGKIVSSNLVSCVCHSGETN